MTRTALFFVAERVHLAHALAAAEVMQAADYRCVLYLFHRLGDAADAALARSGVIYDYYPSYQHAGRLATLLRGSTPLRRMHYYYQEYQHRRGIIRQLIAQHQPDILLLPEDNVSYDTALWIQQARQQRIPSVILPVTIADQAEFAEVFQHHPEHHVNRLTARVFARLFPRWVYTYRGQRLLRLPIRQAFIHELAGTAPPQPWVLNSGCADALAVESPRMLRHYLRLGLPESQLVVTGTFQDDAMAAARDAAQAQREALYAELGMPNRPLLLLSPPPDQHQAGRAAPDYATHDALLDDWLRTAADASGYNVGISLHPRLSDLPPARLEVYGGRILPRPVSALIPLCDLYVASVSATIRQAIACGIPVINFDAYQYGYADYADVAGVRTCTTREDFRAWLKRLTTDADVYAACRADQAAAARDWALLDGQSSARLLALFEALIGKHRR